MSFIHTAWLILLLKPRSLTGTPVPSSPTGIRGRASAGPSAIHDRPFGRAGVDSGQPAWPYTSPAGVAGGAR